MSPKAGLAASFVAVLSLLCCAKCASAIVVPGLDRLPGTPIEGMPDQLWSQHTAEIQQMFESDGGSISFQDFCAQYAGIPPARQTEAMIQWAIMKESVEGTSHADEGISPMDTTDVVSHAPDEYPAHIVEAETDV